MVASDYFYSGMEPLSKYSPVTLHLSSAIRILNENPAIFNYIFSLQQENYTKSKFSC